MNEFKRLILRTEVEEDVPVCIYRFLIETQITGVLSDGTITWQAIDKLGVAHTEEWVVGGSGEEQFHTFGAGYCVIETSVGIDGGNLVANIWDDATNCCP